MQNFNYTAVMFINYEATTLAIWRQCSPVSSHKSRTDLTIQNVLLNSITISKGVRQTWLIMQPYLVKH